MGLTLSNFLHRLFNPHCPHCEVKVDPVVEELRTELASLRFERDRLLKYILEEPKHNIQVAQPETEDTEEAIQPRTIPWPVRRQMLEAEDRKVAELQKQAKRDQEAAIKELEKNLKITENTTLDLENGNVQSKPEQVDDGAHLKHG